jgi:hypothetical protein
MACIVTTALSVRHACRARGTAGAAPQQAAQRRGACLLAQVHTERVDMLLGVGPQNVHLVLWGSHSEEALDICLGIPAATLQQLLGIQGLPDEYVLPLRVGGTVDRPVVDWKEASKKLTILSALQAYRRNLHEQGGAQQQAPAGAAAGREEAAAGGSWWQRAMGFIGSSAMQFLEEAEQRFEAEVTQVPPRLGALPWEGAGASGGAAAGGGAGSGLLAGESEAVAVAGTGVREK